MPKELKEILVEFQKYAYAGKTNPGIEKARAYYNELNDHASGKIIDLLIEKNRPNETDDEMNYRKTIVSSITSGVFSKVWTCVGKIRKSRDFVIKYPEDIIPAGIPLQEFPKVYFEDQYPGEISFENFMFDTLMRQMLLDTGAVNIVMPTPLEQDDKGKYPTPIHHIFNSPNVLEFKENDYAIVKSDEKAEYNTTNGVSYEGSVYYIATTQEIVRLEQTDDKGTVEVKEVYQHNRGELPAKKMPGTMDKRYGSYLLTKSRIHVMAGPLNDLYREWSDFQISKVINAHPETVEFRSVECSGCNGSGKQINRAYIEGETGMDATIVCSVCEGQRYTTVGPFKKQIVTPTKLSEHPVPWPPKMFIARDVETLRFQDEQIEKGIYRCLSTVNMEHLVRMPTAMAESGIKKALDVDELLVLIYSVACDLMSVANWSAKWIVDQRYEARVTSQEDRRKMAPNIPVPERLDLLNMETYIERMKGMKDAGASPYLISEMHKEVAAKQFSNDPEKYALMELIATLDPLIGYGHDDKALMKANGAVSEEDLVISAHIYPWIFDIMKAGLLGTTSGEKMREKCRQELVKKAEAFIKAKQEKEKANMKMLPPGVPAGGDPDPGE